MQLRELKLRNIRSYREATLALGPGTTLIVGDVGSGKTSLLYGIELALFGFAEVEAPYLVRQDASEAEVTVGLADGDDRIEVSRHLKRLTRKSRASFEVTAATFRRNGAATQYSATELRQRVIDLLGFPDNPNPRAHSDLWRWAVYLPQERMRDVLDQEAGSRLETVRKSLGLEQYRIASENAHDVVAPRLRADAEKLEAEAEGLRHHDDEFTRLSAEIEAQDAALPELTEQVARLRGERDEQRRSLEALEQRRQSAEFDRTRLNELDGQIASARARTSEVERRAGELRLESETLERELTSLATTPGELERHDAALAELRGRREGLRRRQSELTSILSELPRLRSERAALEATQRGAQRQLIETAQEVERAEAALQTGAGSGPLREPPAPTPRGLADIDRDSAQIEERRSVATSEVGRLDGAAHEVEELLTVGRCPRCHQAVRPEEFESHRAEALRAVEEARRTAAELETSATSLREERRARERYERAHDRWIERERAQAELLGRRDRLRASVQELTAAQDRAVAALGALARNITRLEPRESELHGLLDPLGEVERMVESADGQRAQLVRDLERLRAGEERRASGRRRTEELARELVAAGEQMSLLSARSLELSERLEGAEGLAQELAHSRQERDRIEGATAHAEQSLARAEQQLADKRDRRDASVAGRRRRGELVADADHRRALAGWLAGPFTEAIEVVERRRLAAAQVEFERTLARHFATLVEDPAMVARCGSSFAPAVEIEGEWTPPEALSGGERTALALAFRLALGEVVRSAGRLQLETLLLDEPTDGFSPEQVIRMGELIESLQIPQVILVSHEGALAAISDRVVRVRKVAGESVLEGTDGGTGRTVASSSPPSATGLAAARRTRRRKATLDGEPATAPPAV
ncbi:MAG: SMC family ATPase [Thermoplasmata archaeon]|nr:SMC family ATPase [Thermoplasmata archaeon]